jgi:L-threonylcarbamoyladenylate synthase
MSTDVLQTALQVLDQDLPQLALYARTVKAPRGMLYRRMPDDAAQAAQQLFAVLRELDAEGVSLIWVESPPPDPAWDGVRDRLARAAAA